MPNRVLRDWTASDRIDRLSMEAEVFFTRLIMKADDFGLYYGNPKLLNSALFPLKDFENSKVSKWLAECVNSGIVRKYSVDGKDYIQIPGFDQRLRIMKSKFPAPPETAEFVEPSNDGQLTDKRPPETETETETKRNEEEPEGAFARVTVWPCFNDFWDKYDKKTDRPKCEKKWAKISQAAREKIMQNLDIYIPSTPDKQYRKNPLTYLNSESWNNEIILPNAKFTDKREEKVNGLRAAFAKQVIDRSKGT